MRRWPELRATLIAAAIALGMIEGCPLPQRGTERDWQRGYVGALRPVQQAVLTPVAWIPRALRFSQRWALFQVGARDRFRIEVEGLVGGVWTLLYRAGDGAHRAYADVLEHRRVWGVWNPTSQVAGRYPQFTTWLATRVLTDRPDVDAVRIRQEKIVVGQGEVTGTGEYAFSYTRRRSGR